MQKKEWIKGNVENVNIVCFKNYAVGGRSAERSWGSLKRQGVPAQRERSLTLRLLPPLSLSQWVASGRLTFC